MAATSDDVLKAIATMQGQISKLATKGEVTTRFDAVDDRLEALTTDLDAFRAETAERFDALDTKTDNVSDVVKATREDARDLRDDVDAIHKGLMKAKPHDVPKDLPSQVRAKGERSSKPAKTSRRRR